MQNDQGNPEHPVILCCSSILFPKNHFIQIKLCLWLLQTVNYFQFSKDQSFSFLFFSWFALKSPGKGRPLQSGWHAGELDLFVQMESRWVSLSGPVCIKHSVVASEKEDCWCKSRRSHLRWEERCANHWNARQRPAGIHLCCSGLMGSPEDLKKNQQEEQEQEEQQQGWGAQLQLLW